MSQISTGLLLFRPKPHLQLLLGHPGAPMWQDKDEEAWTIPKYYVDDKKDLLKRAKHSFEESFGFIPDGNYIKLGSLSDEKEQMHVWAVEYNIPDDFIFEPFWFEMEWPTDSGKMESFPEMDQIQYFGPFEARKKILPQQAGFIPRFVDIYTQIER